MGSFVRLVAPAVLFSLVFYSKDKPFAKGLAVLHNVPYLTLFQLKVYLS